MMNDLIRQIGVIIIYIIIFAWIGVVCTEITLNLKRKYMKENLGCFTKINNKAKEKNAKSGLPVSVGLNYVPIHRCCPATDQYGSFCLLAFAPGPVRFSLSTWTA